MLTSISSFILMRHRRARHGSGCGANPVNLLPLVSIACTRVNPENCSHRSCWHWLSASRKKIASAQRLSQPACDRPLMLSAPRKNSMTAFLTFMEGITSQADREWYASLMLNRLMFVYFIQRQGFLDTKKPGALDGDPNYLSNRLKMMQEQHGKDTFHTFYRYFLLRLFHDGLSKPQHSPALEKLLGKVPYLNGGLFDVHVLEHDNPDIQIPDEAFEKLFGFFDDFDWHLDDRPLRNDKEINPDVLGYIFEKYINQKQMGAYYTKEDITEYISKNTIIPYIVEAAEQKCLIAFDADGPVWSLLRDNPDRYIYDAVKKGCEQPLPPEIEVGVQDISRRAEWNKPASTDYALPTEIWREVAARRARYAEIS